MCLSNIENTAEYLNAVSNLDQQELEQARAHSAAAVIAADLYEQAMKRKTAEVANELLVWSALEMDVEKRAAMRTAAVMLLQFSVTKGVK